MDVFSKSLERSRKLGFCKRGPTNGVSPVFSSENLMNFKNKKTKENGAEERQKNGKAVRIGTNGKMEENEKKTRKKTENTEENEEKKKKTGSDTVPVTPSAKSRLRKSTV